MYTTTLSKALEGYIDLEDIVLQLKPPCTPKEWIYQSKVTQ